MHLAIIGTGAMGGAMARAFLNTGATVTVYNRTRSKTDELVSLGARVADDPAEALASAEGTIFALTNADSLHDLARGYLASGFSGEARALSVSVLTPQEFEQIRREFAGYGIRLSEVAVGAYPEHVRNRQADCLLAAENQDKAFWKDVIGLLGDCHELDAPGDASKAYMAFCIPYMFQPLAAAYALAVMERLGLPSAMVPKLLASNPTIASASASILADEMLRKDYHRSQFSIDNFVDMSDQVIRFTTDLGINIELLQCIRDQFHEVSLRGMGKLDVPAIFEHFK